MGSAVIASLCIHLLRLAERVEELSVPSAEARLARYVLRQPARAQPARIQGARKSELEVELGMKKKDLATHLAMAPETLSRVLRRWRERGWVTDAEGGSGALLSILDGAALEELAHPDGSERA